MEITKTLDGDKATLALDGWLNAQEAPLFASAVDELGDDVAKLELDFSKLEYLSSAGIRQIVATHKKMNGNLVVSNVSPEVMEVFRLTGVANRLNIV